MTDTAAAIPLEAEQMAEQASAAMVECLLKGMSFRLEAGAGAGKTHALIEALEWLVKSRGDNLRSVGAQIACITYTNVAVDEIVNRVGSPPSVWMSTIHRFLWHLISPFQKALREELEKDEKVREKLGDAAADLGSRRISYDDVGRLRLQDTELSVSHDHVVSLAATLLSRPKFRKVWLSRFPILLLDEYQDTNLELMTAIRDNLLAADPPLQMGLFGDHWQRIYEKVCGLVEDDRITYIPKEANFRSCRAVVDVLNRIRPDLPQAVSREMATSNESSDVVVLHTNGWPGERGKGAHKNALLQDQQDMAVAQVQTCMKARGWHFREGSTSVLRLTNKSVARTEGFSDLLNVFNYADGLLRRHDPFVDMFAGRVEPAAAFVAEGRRTAALETLGWGAVRVQRQADKARAREWLDNFMTHRASGSVGDVVDHLNAADLITAASERALRRATAPQEEGEDERAARNREHWEKFRQVPYDQVRRWHAYECGNTMLSTKHGVKGAEFDEVVIVFGGGWSKYDFPRMLAEWDASKRTNKDVDRFERARNLFYVTVSRARHKLALVFLKTLDAAALEKVADIFGTEAIIELPFQDP